MCILFGSRSSSQQRFDIFEERVSIWFGLHQRVLSQIYH